MLGSAESEMVRLIGREIIFAEFQPMITIPQRHRRTDGQTTRGRVRAGPSFPTCSFSAAAAENQRVEKTERRSIYSADRHATRLTTSQSDSTQLKAGNLPWQYRATHSFAR